MSLSKDDIKSLRDAAGEIQRIAANHAADFEEFLQAEERKLVPVADPVGDAFEDMVDWVKVIVKDQLVDEGPFGLTTPMWEAIAETIAEKCSIGFEQVLVNHFGED